MNHASKGGSSVEGRLYGAGQFLPRKAEGPEYTARRARARADVESELARPAEERDWLRLRDALAEATGCLHPADTLRKAGDEWVKAELDAPGGSPC